MTFEQLKGLKDKAQREAQAFYLAEGEHLVLELGKALTRRPALAASRILVSHEYLAAGLPAGFPAQLPRETLNARHISQLSDTRSPQGVIAVVPILPAPPPAEGERAVYLHEIQDPGNLGTILRTLAWFGGFRCLLSPDSVDPYNAKVVRASMGAVFELPVETEVTLDTVAQRHPRAALLDVGGRAVSDGDLNDFSCLMFGNEARGATPAMRALASDAVFSIPHGALPGGARVESLNLAATVNICAYELSRVGAVSGADTPGQNPSSARR
ncbi:MAG: TrmH family RNA methyltransferase [Gammaproteobacteria bacterium]|jgi:TrmH family RNA methyltransferase